MADVQVTIGASIGELQTKLAEAQESVKSFGESVRSVAEAIGVGLGIEAIRSFVESMAVLGEQTERMAAILGMTTKEIGAFGLIARVTGGSAEQMSFGLERLAINLQRAQSGAGPTAEALKAMGVNAKSLIGLPLPEVVGHIADQFSRWSDGTNKTALAIALFGRAGANMIPILDQGRAGIQEWMGVAEQAGASMSPIMTGKLADLEKSLVVAKTAFTALGASIVASFAPSLQKGTEEITKIIEQTSEAIRNGVYWQGVLENIRDGLAQGEIVLRRYGEAMYLLVTGQWGALASGQAFENAQKRLADAAAEHTRRLDELLNKGRELARELEREFSRFKTGATKAGAPSLSIIDKDALAADLAYWKGVIEKADADYQLHTEHIKSMAKDYSITEFGKTSMLLGEIQKRETAELNAIEHELAHNDLTKTKRQELENEKTKIVEKAVKDRQKVLDEERSFEVNAVNEVVGAWNSQLRGLLTGTTSWAQAMKNIFLDLVVKLIEYFEKLAVGKIMAALLPDPAVVASAMKGIGADAGQAYMGFTAFYAPLLGPGAPAAAAAETAAAAGTAAAMTTASYETGAWEIPGNMMAFLHAGEMVVPAGPAGDIRSGASGGGGTFHINLQAWDGASVQSFLRNGGASVMARELGRAMQMNPDLRPAFTR